MYDKKNVCDKNILPPLSSVSRYLSHAAITRSRNSASRDIEYSWQHDSGRRNYNRHGFDLYGEMGRELFLPTLTLHQSASLIDRREIKSALVECTSSRLQTARAIPIDRLCTSLIYFIVRVSDVFFGKIWRYTRRSAYARPLARARQGIRGRVRGENLISRNYIRSTVRYTGGS